MKNNKKIIGDFGEQVATEFLIKNGYYIVSRNLQISHQEIDIIASIGELIVFVEVKTRVFGSGFEGEEALDSRKINNLKKAILSYSRERFIDLDCIQLDLIVINIQKPENIANIKHYKEII